MHVLRRLRARLIIIAFIAGAFLPGVLAASAQAPPGAADAPRGTIVEPLGAWFPSCRSITYKGSAGAIHVQASDKGYVAWGTPRKLRSSI
jgi:invasion protein IalB